MRILTRSRYSPPELRTEQTLVLLLVSTVANRIVPSSVVLHDNKLTHTDLKPENILFMNSDFTMSYNVEKVGRVRAAAAAVVAGPLSVRFQQ